jgi:hypothetical protein
MTRKTLKIYAPAPRIPKEGKFKTNRITISPKIKRKKAKKYFKSVLPNKNNDI